MFISAAEQSADLHAAKLIRAVHRVDPTVRFVGVAGEQMRAAGCAGIFDMTAHAAMLAGMFRVAPQAWRMLRTARAYLRANPVDLALVIDSPMLHLPIAKHARRAGVPVLYYIAPQVWAWAKSRVRRVRRRTSRLAVILPFEEQFFRDYGIPADYVGHPLFDTLANRQIDAEAVAGLRRKGSPLVVIMPGSRTHVAHEVFPGQLEVAAAIHAAHPGAHFCISVANARTRPIVESALADASIPYSLHEEENGPLLTAADFALVASGTATLETAYYHVPMVVMYNATRWGWYVFGKWVTCTPHFSIVNILAGRAIVPEFMPFYRSTEPIKRAALEMLEPQRLAEKRCELEQMMTPLIKTGASDNAARIVLEMLAAIRR
ncbi:MAG TPA: lipid-A-disaccharide synthase [Phycisphaerae bacterium]|nr:lipid-A-disaccharide synthase [Phycisphaerales bacterium]HRX83862.1 lipid-A-disaccharide synthase [Phycisphaerae bacterium]